MSIIMDATNGITTANLTANTSISTPSIGSSTLTTPTISGLMTLTGGQIKFPATQVPSSDANTLDDYEEGTFTPLLKFGGNSVGMTYTVAEGRYIKIGRLVSLSFRIVVSNKGSSVGIARIDVPFVASSGTPYSGVASYTTNFTTYAPTSIFMDTGNSVVDLYNSHAQTRILDSNFTNTSYVYMQITYITD